MLILNLTIPCASPDVRRELDRLQSRVDSEPSLADALKHVSKKGLVALNEALGSQFCHTACRAKFLHDLVTLPLDNLLWAVDRLCDDSIQTGSEFVRTINFLRNSGSDDAWNYDLGVKKQ